MFFLSLLLCHIKAVGWDILSAVKALWTDCLEAWYARYIYVYVAVGWGWMLLSMLLRMTFMLWSWSSYVCIGMCLFCVFSYWCCAAVMLLMFPC